MALLPIVIWGDPILTQRAAAVEKITSVDRALIEDMKETMLALDGAGLAAPQVGVAKRLFVFRIGEETHALVNPEITKRDGQRTGDEACLSVPGVQARVPRAARVTITGLNERGKSVSYDCEDSEEQGRAGTCVQHELDHLDGILYVERMIPDSLAWLIEMIDENGEDILALEETTPDDVLAAYRKHRLPPDVHVPDILRARIERDD